MCQIMGNILGDTGACQVHFLLESPCGGLKD